MRQSLAGLALIRREVHGRTLWLAQWNRHWHAYALLGGHKRPEETFRECVIREVEEELGLKSSTDFHTAAEPLAHLEYTAWSQSAQIETEYTVELFEVQLTDAARRKIEVAPVNRWLTEDDIQSKQIPDGKAVSPTMALLLHKADLRSETKSMNVQMRRDKAAQLADSAYDDVERRDFHTARQKLEEALQLDENCHCAHSEYALVLTVFGESKQARRHILRAIALASWEPKYWAALSKWHFDEGELEAALRCILVAELLDATYPTVPVAKMHILKAAGASGHTLDELAEESRRFYNERRVRADGTPLQLGDIDAFVSRATSSGDSQRAGAGFSASSWLRRFFGADR